MALLLIINRSPPRMSPSRLCLSSTHSTPKSHSAGPLTPSDWPIRANSSHRHHGNRSTTLLRRGPRCRYNSSVIVVGQQSRPNSAANVYRFPRLSLCDLGRRSNCRLKKEVAPCTGLQFDPDWGGACLDASRQPSLAPPTPHMKENVAPLLINNQAHARLAQSVERETLIKIHFKSHEIISRSWVRPPRRAQFPAIAILLLFLVSHR
ncbi:hypothetical protein QBC34DRAFT_148612 [Podospora aff. communis PSN243]|uniref:Uncharacterized protein n=1 Tax=Podospora aff. communis PSN243 TaxID=3040156 RepID=A0AAV9GGJ1_9PEZI|nr:hypothetical protein QBC34DRAFT_148612 [Podospora aff. communis PSN243]